jgi:hypothetical protein
MYQVTGGYCPVCLKVECDCKSNQVNNLITNKSNVMNEVKEYPPQDSVKTEPAFGESILGLVGKTTDNSKESLVDNYFATIADVLNNEFLSLPHSSVSAMLYHHALGEVINAHLIVVKVLTNKY